MPRIFSEEESIRKFILTIALITSIFPRHACAENTISSENSTQLRPLRGTFLQYQDWMKGIKGEDWEKELEAMKAAGVSEIIIQWLKHNDEDFTNEPFNSINERLMNYADRNNMKVYLGLWFSDDWWTKAEKADNDYFRISFKDNKTGKLLSETLSVLAKAKVYTRHACIAGWYIPQELWNQNYDNKEIERINTCLATISSHAKKIFNGQVLISPIFNPTGYPSGTPKIVETCYSHLLANTGITDVLVQDGVGARKWSTNNEIRKYVTPYLIAFKNASHSAGARLWTNVELFEISKAGDLHPSTLERLKMQISIEAPFADKDKRGNPLMIAFDFFHYMSPIHGGDTKRERIKFYRDYVYEFVKQRSTSESGAK